MIREVSHVCEYEKQTYPDASKEFDAERNVLGYEIDTKRLCVCF